MIDESGFSPTERANKQFPEKFYQHKDLWESVINDSSLKKENKDKFLGILEVTRNPGESIETYLNRIKEALYNAVTYSYETDEALAVYKNIEADLNDLEQKLFS